MLVRGNKLCNFVVRSSHSHQHGRAVCVAVLCAHCVCRPALPKCGPADAHHVAVFPETGARPSASPRTLLRRAPQEWGQYKLIYRRYASLYFCVGVDPGDNELLLLDTLHMYVEALDKYFGNVCELDLVFNFHKAYYILDEVFIAGELQESSKKVVLRAVAEGDAAAEPDMPESDRS